MKIQLLISLKRFKQVIIYLKKKTVGEGKTPDKNLKNSIKFSTKKKQETEAEEKKLLHTTEIL